MESRNDLSLICMIKNTHGFQFNIRIRKFINFANYNTNRKNR